MRVLRFINSPIGRVPIQVDLADYRDVNGIKFPFKMAFLWLDGRYNAEIKDVKVNVPIDAKVFAKPPTGVNSIEVIEGPASRRFIDDQRLDVVHHPILQ